MTMCASAAGAAALAAALAVALAVAPAGPTTVHPLEILSPAVAVSATEHERLDRGDVIARVEPAGGDEAAVLAMTRIDAPPDALVDWLQAIAALKRSSYVRQIARFSEPPRLSDLDALTLDDADLDAIMRCEPGACSLKLSAAEIAVLRASAVGAGEGWRTAVQQAFRRVVLTRLDAYRYGGLEALAPNVDHGKPSSLAQSFDAIMQRSSSLDARAPAVASWLRHYPAADTDDIDSFFYWSKEYYGAGKPVISVTHVGIIHDEDDAALPVIVAGKEILATHYSEAALGLTMYVRDVDTGVSYLAYLNRSRLDLLGGPFGWVVRSVLERRLAGEAPAVLRGLRARIESGRPPQ